MARASALHAEGRGFESHYLHKNIGIYISWLDSEPDKFEVIGSSPIMPTYWSSGRCGHCGGLKIRGSWIVTNLLHKNRVSLSEITLKKSECYI